MRTGVADRCSSCLGQTCYRYAGARPPRCYSALAPADDLRVRPIPARVTLYARPRPEMAREAHARPRSLKGASDGIMKRSNALKRPILLESGLILLLALVCCRAPRAAEFSYTPPNLVESGASATAKGHRAASGPQKGPQDRTLSSIALLTSSRPKHSEDLIRISARRSGISRSSGERPLGEMGGSTIPHSLGGSDHRGMSCKFRRLFRRCSPVVTDCRAWPAAGRPRSAGRDKSSGEHEHQAR